MKIQLLVAAEADYSEYLSNTLSAKYADTFAVRSCSSKENLRDVLAAKKYDVLLVEPEWIPYVNKKNVRMVLALISERSTSTDISHDVYKTKKYQRISTLVSDALEYYSSVAPGAGDFGKSKGQIIAVWSPTGGVGKTTVALAYATRSVSLGSSVTYLGLEHFSSSGSYFSGQGKSVSALFEKLASNAELLVKGIRQHDSGSGIDYFNPPINYDDINELTRDDVTALVTICAHTCDSVVVDLPSICDGRTQAVFDIANMVIIVTDGSTTSAAKLEIFMSQHGVYEDIRHKTRFAMNKGAKTNDARFEASINLPFVKSDSPVSVYKALSGNSFDISL